VIGVTSLALLGLVLCLGCPLSVGTAVLRGRHVRVEREEAERERLAAEEARQAEERARRAAEEARAEAEKAQHEAERREKQADKLPGTEK
jgi:sensor c-di-GMP phosphodiesterase-like protein